MELSRAIEIVEALTDGHDPFTGEVFEQSNVLQRADTVRALTLAVEAMRSRQRTKERRRRMPDNFGKPWTEEETNRLISAFDQGVDVSTLAKNHQRTRGGIQRKLEHLGKIQDWMDVQ